jgi:hypothetical protein
MTEIFDIIKAVNNLKDTVNELCNRVNSLNNKNIELLTPKYVREKEACEILGISPRTLAKMRANNELPYSEHHRKILYPYVGLCAYLDNHCIDHSFFNR